MILLYQAEKVQLASFWRKTRIQGHPGRERSKSSRGGKYIQQISFSEFFVFHRKDWRRDRRERRSGREGELGTCMSKKVARLSSGRNLWITSTTHIWEDSLTRKALDNVKKVWVQLLVNLLPTFKNDTFENTLSKNRLFRDRIDHSGIFVGSSKKTSPAEQEKGESCSNSFSWSNIQSFSEVGSQDTNLLIIMFKENVWRLHSTLLTQRASSVFVSSSAPISNVFWEVKMYFEWIWFSKVLKYHLN